MPTYLTYANFPIPITMAHLSETAVFYKDYSKNYISKFENQIFLIVSQSSPSSECDIEPPFSWSKYFWGSSSLSVSVSPFDLDK